MKIDCSNFTKNFIRALIIRLFIGIYVIRTFHKPDELYQGPEVAHNLVYGQGYLSWEWVYAHPIRNPVFPYIFSIPYRILNMLGLDNNLYLIQVGPKILQAFIGAGFDSMLIKLNSYYNGQSTNNLLVFMCYTNFAILTYLSRSYVNGIEALFSMVAFYFWLHRNQDKKNDIISRIIAIFTFVMRGTSVLFWVVVWPYELLKFHSSSMKSAINFIIKNIATVVLMCLTSMLVSYLHYGQFVFVEYNFFYYNTVLGWSSLCGDTPFHYFFTYYLVKGFAGYTIAIFYACYLIVKKKNKENNEFINRKKEIILIMLIQMVLISTSKHKQLRFLIIEFPFLMILAVYGMTKFPLKWIKRVIVVLSFIFGICYFLLINVYIKSNTYEMTEYLQNSPKAHKVLILSGPYQLPQHCRIHRKDLQIDIPYVGFQVISTGISYGQYAYQYPQQYLEEYFKHNKSPSHIIFLKQHIEKYQVNLNVTKNKYKLAKSVWSPALQNLDRTFNLYQMI